MKRVFDLTIAVPLFLAVVPIYAVIFLLVRINLGGPVIFRQERPGLHGRPFELIKFRTMTSEVDDEGSLLDDGLRLTRLGKWLRSTSLDELPELWNVIKGEMSLVGPRPLLPEYLPLYSRYEGRRHEVRPGVTGWAQVNGRNSSTWSERLAMDVWYVDNHNLRLDLKILFRTVKIVLRREGVSADGHVTMSKFRGSDSRP